MEPLLLAIGLAAGGSVALVALYIYSEWAVPRTAVRSRIDRGHDLAFNPAGVLRRSRRRIPFVDILPVSPEGLERTQLRLERAGMSWRVREFLALRIGLGGGLALVAGIALAVAGLAPVGAILLAFVVLVIGWALPSMYVSRRTKRRLIRVEEQLPDALTAIAKSLRAGSGLLQAIAFAADETPAPLGTELRATLRDLQLGADPVEVFDALSRRVGSPDLDIAVTAIVIQRTVGGNLSEILANVTATIRERAKIQREVRVLVTRQMLQANLTAALPVVMAVLFIAITPDIGGALLDTTAGNIALGIALACEVMGIVAVRRLAIIEV